MTSADKASQAAAKLEDAQLKVGQKFKWLGEVWDNVKSSIADGMSKMQVHSSITIETNFHDKDVFELHQLAKKVRKEKHYLEMFVRFQKVADDIFFSPVSPIYNALPLVIDHFKDRFADQRWLIYDIKRRYGYFYDLNTVQEITLTDENLLLRGKLDDNLMAEDEKRFQELWKGYFKAMTIKERINLRHQRQQMPRRFWKFLTEKQ